MLRECCVHPALRRPFVALAWVGALVLAGCGGSATPAAVSTVPTSSTIATTTTSTTPPTTVFGPSAPQPSADEAGARIVAAWKTGDRTAALTDATPAAVDALFAQPYPVGGVQARGCSAPVAGPTSCVYRIFANSSLLELSAISRAGGWYISSARFEG